MDPEIDMWERGAARYPTALEDLPNPPARVWTVGALPLRPSVAIVGTRRASAAARGFAEDLAERLSRAGVAIVSGGAAGVDIAAHRGAMRGSAATWVVQAAPLDAPYPVDHHGHFERVLNGGGGWLSETAPGEPVYRGRFIARNRLIAALSDVVVVVSAPARSGALSTARWARRLGRPLFAVPASPWDEQNAGNLGLLADGAHPCLDAREIASHLGLSIGRRRRRRGVPREFEPLLRALSPRPKDVDELSLATRWPVPQVLVGLEHLRRLGLARSSGRGWRKSP